jgi:lipoate---protein ligase
LQNQYFFSRSDWRVIALTIADQQRHIAQSEDLLSEIAPGKAPALVWSQAEPDALVLGFSQKETIVNSQAIAEQRIPLYHRRAGGTAVLVGTHLLGLDVVLAADHPLVLTDIVESYRWFGETWVQALRLLGIETHVVLPAEAHRRIRSKHTEDDQAEMVLRRACYASNSSYEVVVGQRKVVGLDMVRRRNGSLLQAGVLLRWESAQLASLLGHTPQEQALLRAGLPQRAIGLDSLAARNITAGEVVQAFEAVLFQEVPLASSDRG